MLNRRQQSKNRTGAAAVEFAVAVSVLIMVVFGSIEFVRLTMLKHSVEHASYVAARHGIIIGAKSKDVKQVAKDHLANFGLTSVTVTVNPGTIDDDTQIVEVVTTVPVTGNSWISPLYFGGDLSGRTRMLAERAAANMSGALPVPAGSGSETTGPATE